MFKLIKFFVLLLVVGVVVLYFQLGSIVKVGVETVGPQVLDVPVSLESSEVSIMGSGTLGNLKVGNPEGFKSDHLFHLGAVKVELALPSLLGDTLRVKKIHIDGAHLIYEGSLVRSNLKTMLDHLSKMSGTDEPGVPDSEKDTSGQDDPSQKKESEKKIIIDHLLISNTKMGYSPFVLNGKSIDLKLGTIEKRDIGKSEGGTDLATAAREIFFAIHEKATEGIEKGGDRLGENIRRLSEQLGGDPKLEKVSEKVKDASKKVSKELNKAADKLKGLFAR
jgi:hypothetical protein